MLTLVKMIVIAVNKNTICLFWLYDLDKRMNSSKSCFSLNKKYLAHINDIVSYSSLQTKVSIFEKNNQKQEAKSNI